MIRTLNLVAAAAASVVLLAVLGFGYRVLPALGPALNPGKGVWTSAQAGEPVTNETLYLTGLTAPATVSFTKAGTASIQAQNQHDLFLALGYVHARFRLTEMDEERRLGEGRLAQLAGPSELNSDKFELRLGLLRTAQIEWNQLGKNSQAARALLAYAQGVNDDIAQVRASGQWPATFTLTGVYPGPWTPVDSLVIQGGLTQGLDYTGTPLDYALLEKSLGTGRTMDWFPVIPDDQQSPYDPGPYKYQGVTPLAPSAASTVTDNPVAGDSESSTSTTASYNMKSFESIIEQTRNQEQFPDSNAWATTTGKTAQLAGDPHVPQTMPSIWYQVALAAPGYDATGISVPGLPGILIGHNEHIAWSLTSGQDQATMFYVERARGDEYYWDGAWRKMAVVHYSIPVRGSSAVQLTVDITVHGPVLTRAGQTTSVDWMGNVPSRDLQAMLGVDQADDFQQFKAALSQWHAPTQNFVYADDQGNIGAITAGYFPQVSPKCQPWLPMSGTGACDVTGVIPYAAVPQVYDPPSRMVVTANQRQVTPAYPYYIGTSADYFDPGYRAAAISQGLAAGASFSSVQNSTKDQLAARIVPKLLAALQGTSLSPEEQTVVSLLRSWDDTMAAGSEAASVWWTFWTDYLSDVFRPWWNEFHVPVSRGGLAVDPAYQASLDEDLEAWTLADHGAASSGAASSGAAGSDAVSSGAAGSEDGAFGAGRTAVIVMRKAFASAVSSLTASYGTIPVWSRIHTRTFRALSGDNGLGYGPRGSGGDAFTPDAAYGDLTSSSGPTWRMIVSLSSSGVSAIGVYPGGQDENPASPWYANQIPLWWDGRYLPVPAPGSVAAGGVEWRLRV